MASGVRSTIRRTSAGSSPDLAGDALQRADRPLQRIAARVELDRQPARHGWRRRGPARPGRLPTRLSHASSAAGSALRPCRGEAGGADPGVDGEANLERLGVGAERPLDPARARHRKGDGGRRSARSQSQRDGGPGCGWRERRQCRSHASRPSSAASPGRYRDGPSPRPRRDRPGRHHRVASTVGAQTALDVRGARNVKVVEIEDVAGDRPARTVVQPGCHRHDRVRARRRGSRRACREAPGRRARSRPDLATARTPMRRGTRLFLSWENLLDAAEVDERARPTADGRR